jgi:hypothetical protein
MNLRKEVLHRLLLAKSILEPARAAAWAQPNAHLVARQLLNAHDAADLAFAGIADHLNKLPPKRDAPSMIECLGLIGSEAKIHVPYFRQLNDARNGLKHTGNLPNTHQWSSVGMDVYEKISGICREVLGISLDEVDESELLLNPDAKVHFSLAKEARASGEFRLALEEIGKALFISLENAAGLEGVRVGRAKAEDALKLTAFGISVNDFLRLQEFLPMVSAPPPDLSVPTEVLWQQSGFGHPGNWRKDVVDFCIGAYLGVALGIQNAPWIPYAVEFSTLYDYKVTAKEEGVEVWEDFVDEHLELAGLEESKYFRSHKRYMQKGESITVSASTRQFVSEYPSLKGEWIKRIRISKSQGFYGILDSDEKADFVDLTQVNITCVPSSLYKHFLQERFPDLQEIPWEEDPLAFRL